MLHEKNQMVLEEDMVLKFSDLP